MDYLTDSYIRRKRFEAKLLAIEIWTLLGEAMNSNQSEQSTLTSLMQSGFKVQT